jgi:hypothetical protein
VGDVSFERRRVDLVDTSQGAGRAGTPCTRKGPVNQSWDSSNRVSTERRAVQALERISHLMTGAEFDINPFIVGGFGEESVAGDARIQLSAGGVL